jgi:hypothetical protein
MRDEITLSLKETDWLLLQATLDDAWRLAADLGAEDKSAAIAKLAYEIRGQAARCLSERQWRREVKTRIGDIDPRIVNKKL